MRKVLKQVRRDFYDYSITARFWTTQRQVQRWAQRTQIFFIVGLGRSGTTSIARLLDLDPAAYVCHEPVANDFIAYLRAFYSPDTAERYVSRFRSKEIFLRAQRHQAQVYGEVNSALRRHVPALCQTFPHATFLHLVRDGRAVVRSMMARPTMTADDPNTATIHPQPDDPWYERWAEMDRFARLCWYWQAENGFIRQTIGPSVRFEDLLSDYTYFSENLLNPCQIQLGSEQWATALAQPLNRTSRHSLAAQEDWSAEQKQTFWSICGHEMRCHGYAPE